MTKRKNIFACTLSCCCIFTLLFSCLVVAEDQEFSRQELLLRIEKLEQAIENQMQLEQERKEQQATQRKEQETADRIQRERVENARLIEEAFEQILIDQGGLLLGPGKYSYVTGLSYTHSSSDRIVIDGFTIEDILVIGDIVSEQVRRDLVISTNTFRIGFEHDLQLDIQIPAGFEDFQSTNSSGDTSKDHTSGIGDVSIAVSHQLVKSSDDWPDTLINLSWKDATGDDPYSLGSGEELALGSGFDSWGLGATSVIASDPVVFFYGVSFTKNLSDKKNGVRVDLGDSVGIQLGMVFALNLNTSMSFGLQLTKTDKVEIDKQAIPASDLLTSMFTVGVSRLFSSQTSMDIEAAIGLTRDSPDVQLSVSFPIKF